MNLLVDHSLLHLLLDPVDFSRALGSQRHLPLLLRGEKSHFLRLFFRIFSFLSSLSCQHAFVLRLCRVGTLSLRFLPRFLQRACLLRRLLRLKLCEQSLFFLFNFHRHVRLAHLLELRHLHRLGLLGTQFDARLFLPFFLKGFRLILQHLLVPVFLFLPLAFSDFIP